MRSFGICLFKYSITESEWQILCVKRSYTYGFLDFLRSGYRMLNPKYTTKLISEMTLEERLIILKQTLKEIHNKLRIFNYKKEHDIIFEKVKQEPWFIKSFKNINAKPLWELPKGRSSRYEHGIITAIREFEEETSVSYQYKILPYKHNFMIRDRGNFDITYYAARIYDDVIIDETKVIGPEIKAVKWISLNDVTDYNGGYTIKKIANIFFEHIKRQNYLET